MAAVLQLARGAAPSAPGAGYVDIYPDTSGLIHILTEAGVNTTVATTDIVAATANLADAAVTNVKLADMAEETIKGRASGAGTGDATDLTAAQVAAILADQFPAIGDATWTDLTLGANWVTTGTIWPTSGYTTAPGYRKIGGIVYLRGTVNCDAGYSTPMATLPADYRPAIDMIVPAISASSATPGFSIVLIKTTGALTVQSPNTSTTYHLHGICFPV